VCSRGRRWSRCHTYSMNQSSFHTISPCCFFLMLFSSLTFEVVIQTSYRYFDSCTTNMTDRWLVNNRLRCILLMAFPHSTFPKLLRFYSFVFFNFSNFHDVKHFCLKISTDWSSYGHRFIHMVYSLLGYGSL